MLKFKNLSIKEGLPLTKFSVKEFSVTEGRDAFIFPIGTVFQVIRTREGTGISTIICREDKDIASETCFKILYLSKGDSHLGGYYGSNIGGYLFIVLPIAEEEALKLIDTGVLPLK